MPQYRLNYFDARGRAEIIRLILTQAGQEFVDHRFNREQWATEKTDSKFKCVVVTEKWICSSYSVE